MDKLGKFVQTKRMLTKRDFRQKLTISLFDSYLKEILFSFPSPKALWPLANLCPPYVKSVNFKHSTF